MAADSFTSATGRKRELEGKTITINAKAGNEGKLFGSVGTVDIAETLTQARHQGGAQGSAHAPGSDPRGRGT